MAVVLSALFVGGKKEHLFRRTPPGGCPWTIGSQAQRFSVRCVNHSSTRVRAIDITVLIIRASMALACCALYIGDHIVVRTIVLILPTKS